jgi:protein O-mannosyl-transferase
LDFWPLARLGAAIDVPDWAGPIERPGARWLVLEKLPLVALAAGDCLMTLRTHFAVSEPLAWSGRIGNAAVSCVAYVVQFFYPANLAAIYPVPPGGPPAWKAAGAIAILAVVSGAAVIWRRRCPYGFVGWFWYLGMLSPVLELVRVADHARADRYMYLPGIGLYITLAWGAARLAHHLPKGRWILVAGAGLVIALLVPCAAWQTSFWYDDETLWTHALQCTTDNDLADICLGFALAQQGRHEEAVALYRHALTIKPNAFQAHVHLGASLSRLGRFDEAMEHLRRALEIDPRGVRAYLNIGQLLVFQGKFDEARAAFEQAIAIDPSSSDARNDLGWALFQQRKIDEAIPHYEAALAINPNLVIAHNNLAEALAARGQTDEARRHYRRALELDPNNSKARAELDKLQHGDAGAAGP